MKSSTLLGGVIALAVIAFVGISSAFTVQQTEQALVLRFGEPVPGRGLVTQPGLHFKVPFIESVIRFDKRILDLEAPRQEVLAADNQRIEVDAFVRYRITDALRFYQTVSTVARANNQLASIVNSSIRRVLGETTLIDIVRESRTELMAQIRDQVNTEGARLGVAVNDVRIRRADLPREISERVFARMTTERQREAADFRAQGGEQAQRIRARADADVTILLADARRKSEEIRGKGDAERNRIFAEAYNRDAGFFSFYRAMQAYEAGLKPEDTRMVLSPNSDFFRFFGSAAGRASGPDATPAPGR